MAGFGATGWPLATAETGSVICSPVLRDSQPPVQAGTGGGAKPATAAVPGGKDRWVGVRNGAGQRGGGGGLARVGERAGSGRAARGQVQRQRRRSQTSRLQ